VHEIVVILVSADEEIEPEVLALPVPDELTEPPHRIRRPVSAADGPLVEVWGRSHIADDRTATYRLDRIESQPGTGARP
jgi:hypothetical protein